MQCNTTMPIRDMENHICIADEASKILTHPLEEPLTPMMEAIGSRIIKSKLAQSADGVTASFQTRGQPIQVMYLFKPRNSSSEVLPPTVKKKKRVSDLGKDEGALSKDCTDVQFRHEVKQLEDSLDGMHLTRVTIPKGQFLTVQADICTSWKKAREHKRWLKQFGISTECESSVRAQQADIIDDNISARWLPLVHKDEDGGTIIKKTPWVIVKSLQAKVFQQLKGLGSLKLLEWNAAIPHDEVWLKIGGDIGGGNFKKVFQIGNVQHQTPHTTLL
ncbi:uncharacterized protein [Apostichopus japonicus]|uniref:uncharacterized protein n=1 Tax=Stichopus japonicus TaxID=307972 RepID=UPI003AB641F7